MGKTFAVFFMKHTPITHTHTHTHTHSHTHKHTDIYIEIDR